MATATTNSNYTGSDIEVLEGLEPVRKRPGMYIGTVDSRGLHHLIWEIVDNCVDEFLANEADLIKVTLHKDGRSITVSDNGRGIPVDKHPKLKRSTLEVILTTLHAGGKFGDKNYARSGGLHGVGSSVVNALSSELIATVHRDGAEYQQSYETGIPTGKVKKVRAFRGTGTTIFFRPDPSIFKRTSFNADTIRQHLEDVSYIHGGLKIIFNDEVHGEKHELSHPDGIAAFLTKMIAEEKKNPVHDPTVAAMKDENGVKVEFVLKWTDSTEEQIRSYVNGIRTHAGGTHENGFKSGVVKSIKTYMDVHKIKPKGITVAAEDIREGIVGVLSVFHGDPMFQGQTKERLNNSEMTGITDALTRSTLESWLNSNPSMAEDVINRIVMSARARLASRSAVSEVRRKSASNRRSSLPGKLFDCSSKDSAKSELFIVEGDSAGGTAVMGRNGATQAVFPLKGKPPNTETFGLAQLTKNEEFRDLIETLGTGIGSDFDIHKLRYGRVILLMDADSDGYHISTLLLTFFFRHMRELIREGRLFIAQPPLYRIAVGKDVHYAQSDFEKEEIVANLPKNRSPEITRFKGLGEMDARQLKETTLDPKVRQLLRVDIESPLEADTTFAQLLGKDPAERYRIIMSEASFVDDVDL